MMVLRRALLALVLLFCCPWRAPVTSDRSGGGVGRGLYRRCPHGAGAAGEYPCGAHHVVAVATVAHDDAPPAAEVIG